MKRLTHFLLVLFVLLLVGCGVSKSQYEQVIHQKDDLEGQVAKLNGDFQKLQKEHEALLVQKETLQSELEKVKGEKEALRVEYDRVLNDKISLKSEYDRLLREKQVIESHVGQLEQKQRSSATQ